MAVTILPVGAVVFRRQPEDYGLQPDGRLPTSLVERPTEANATLAAARRTLTFWLFSVGNIAVAALGTGLLFHHYAIMAASGVERPVAALVFVPYGLVTAGANLVSGLLLDRISPRFCSVPGWGCWVWPYCWRHG